MATATIDDARAAKIRAKVVLSRVPGLRGIGLTRRGKGYAVKVNLEKPVIGRNLPTEVEGVPLVFEVVGPIKSY